MAQYDDELNRIKEGLEHLRQLDGRRSFWRREWRLFGAQRHRYQLGPTLSETELTTFESKHGIALPTDYRAFLQRIGNGGAGPGYGITPLEVATVGDLSQPFPLTRSSDLYSDTELEDLGFDNNLNGVLQLCHRGCGMYTYLVVNGPQYGVIWYDNGDFHSNKKRFMDWYLEWIDGSIVFLEKR